MTRDPSSDDFARALTSLVESAPATPQPPAADGVPRGFLVAADQRGVELARAALSAEMIVGRGVDNALSVQQASLGRKHACVICRGGVVRIHDLKSTGGTFLNGKRIVGEVELKPGDVVHVGAITLTLELLE